MENKPPKGKSGKSQSTSRMPSYGKASLRKQAKSKSTSALPKNQPRSKKDSYKVVSKSSLLQDFKNTATSGLANVKQRFTSISALLKHPKRTKSERENYAPMSEQPTPIKLYSPFTIESPEPSKVTNEDRTRLRQQLFVSPTNRIKEDVTHLEIGIEELKFISKKVESNYQFRQQLSTNPFLSGGSTAIPPTASKSASHISTRLMFEDEYSLI